MHLALVIIRQLHVIGVAILKSKANAPLVVDGDGILACPVSFQWVESVAWGNLQIVYTCCQIKVLQSSQCSFPDF